MSKTNKILALSMRPKTLEDLVGQDKIVNSLSKQLATGRIPHFFLIKGPIGSGKTTFARILAEDLLAPAQIEEINAANKTGIDDIRSLVDRMRYKPVHPKQYRVVIMDEVHQLSISAQNALLTELEDAADHVFYIFCTSNDEKVIPALRRRAYVISPNSLNKATMTELVQKASCIAHVSIDVAPLIGCLLENGVTSPGLVLQAAEKYFTGMSAAESLLLSDVNKGNHFAFCKDLSSGQWSKCAPHLENITKADVPGLRNMALGFLKSMLLKSTGVRAYNISKAINIIAGVSYSMEEGTIVPAFVAASCLACDFLKPSVATSANSNVSTNVAKSSVKTLKSTVATKKTG